MPALFFDITANFAKGQLPSTYNAAATIVVLDSVIAGTGTVTTNGTTTLTGSGTVFLNTFQAGDTITVAGETIRTIASVSSDTVLIVTSAFSTSASGLAYVVGGGARFPDPAVDGPYNCVWWDQKTYPDPDDDPKKEIVRVTAKTGDTLTISRAQEDTLATTKNSFGGLYAISNVLTKFVMDQIRGTFGTLVTTGFGHVILDNGVVMTQEPSLNFRDYFTLSDTAGVSTNVNIDVTGLAGDSTFLSAVITNINLSGDIAVVADGTTITGTGTTLDPLVAVGGGGGGHVIQDNGTPLPAEPALNFKNFFTITDNPAVSTDVNLDVVGLAGDSTFVTNLAANSTFVTSLASNTTFVNALTSNSTFISFVQSITASGGSVQIDQTPDTGTYGLLSGTVNGSNTTFTVSTSEYLTGKLQVYLNGIFQQQGGSADWQETTPGSGTFDFITAPLTGDIITAVYQETTSSSSSTALNLFGNGSDSSAILDGINTFSWATIYQQRIDGQNPTGSFTIGETITQYHSKIRLSGAGSTGALSVGDTITGGSSGATCVYRGRNNSREFAVSNIVGTFTNSEAISTAGGYSDHIIKSGTTQVVGGTATGIILIDTASNPGRLYINTITGTFAIKEIVIGNTSAALFQVIGLSTQASTYLMSQNVQLIDLTVNASIILDTNGFALWGQGILLNNGKIIGIGGKGGWGDNSTNGTQGAGGKPGINVASGAFAATSPGRIGSDGVASNSNGIAGTAGANAAPSLGSIGVAGGNGGNANTGAARTGGAGGATGTNTPETLGVKDNLFASITTATANTETEIPQILFPNGASSAASLSPSSGSGSGASGAASNAGTAAATSGGSGASGASGALIPIIFRTITNTGTIEAIGGFGGDAGYGYAQTDGSSNFACWGGSGGGAGGPGGVVILIYTVFTGNNPTVTGGTGGTADAGGDVPGTPGGTFTAGTNGVTGTTGKYYKIKFKS